MKKLLILFLLLCGSVCASTRIMTYNIEVKSWFTTSWESRKCAVVEDIEVFRPDILCLQEVAAKQADDLLAEFGKYGYVAFGKNKACYHNAIFYSEDKIGIVASGNFSLGGWGRGCVWALCFDKEDGSLFYVYNTHFSLMQIFRVSQAKTMLDKMNSRVYDLPVVLCGDLNASRDNEVLEILSRLLVDFGPDIPTHKNRKIDYIMGYGSRALESHVIITDKYGSDHEPVAVVVDVEFRNENDK
jgi:endonuclease/exonuclease/phosphatase family metal-dependent hydrolase